MVESETSNDTFILDDYAHNLDMSLGPRIFWDVLFSCMIFVAVVGNLIVLWIVIGKNYFLKNC